MHQIEWFKVWFFENFLGRGSPSPSPDPSPRFFSGFALGSGFALNSRALRALDSGFALDTRALCALDSGFALNFRLGTLVWPPPNKFLDPPLIQTRFLCCFHHNQIRCTLELRNQLRATNAWAIAWQPHHDFCTWPLYIASLLIQVIHALTNIESAYMQTRCWWLSHHNRGWWTCKYKRNYLGQHANHAWPKRWQSPQEFCDQS